MNNMDSEYFPLNAPFKPSPSLVTWFITNFLLLVLFVIVVAFLPVIVFTPVDNSTVYAIIGGIAAGVVLFIVWTRLYYESMWYELHRDEMRWRRGVLFRRTGIVPYNRITNIDIRQGPIMRALSISTLSIQTAGYSGKAQAEIRIEGIVHAEELRELIRTMVRSCAAGGDGTGTGSTQTSITGKTTDSQILEELRIIRALLEQKL
jgi:membrane protein YdbS with pleckstrin-like domain